MEIIDLVFLGTGSAVPTLSRNHNGIYFKYKDRSFLIDCGEGIQRQMRKAKLNICKISDILITHTHGDHILGLPGLLHTMSKSGYNKELIIYCPKKFRETIKRFLDITGVNGVSYKIIEVAGNFIDNKYFSVIAFPLEHDISCNGYMFKEKDRLRVDKKKLSKYNLKGKDIGRIVDGNNVIVGGRVVKCRDVTYLEKGRKISFVFDTKYCRNVDRLVKDSDLAIIEGVFLEIDDNGKKMAKKYKHMTIEGASRAARKGRVKKLVISHISQRYEYNEKVLLAEAKKIFENVEIAKDFMALKI